MKYISIISADTVNFLIHHKRIFYKKEKKKTFFSYLIKNTIKFHTHHLVLEYKKISIISN